MTTDEELDQAWFAGYSAAINVLEKSLDDIEKQDMGNALSLETVREMLKISKNLVKDSYERTLGKGRVLN